MDIQVYLPYLLLLLFSLLFVVFAVIAVRLRSRLIANESELAALSASITTHSNKTELQVSDIGHQQSEAQARSLVASRHLHDLQRHVENLENQIRELKQQDPSMRLYQRAAELVKEGATIQEIMDACDIPQAEAEMIMMVHNNKSN